MTNILTVDVEQNISSRNTSINGSRLPRVFSIVGTKLGWELDSVNLDIGGGRYNNATEYLAQIGVRNLIWDPYNRSEDHNAKIADYVSEELVDTVTLSNVLCVIAERRVQDSVLQMAYDVLKPFGSVYITVYEGDKSSEGRQTGPDQWQENRKLADYLDQVKSVFGEAEMRWGMIRAVKSV